MQYRDKNGVEIKIGVTGIALLCGNVRLMAVVNLMSI